MGNPLREDKGCNGGGTMYRISRLLIAAIFTSAVLAGASFAAGAATYPSDGPVKERGPALYARMSALCEETSGETGVIIAKKYGRFTRLTRVGEVEGRAFFDSGLDKTTPWLIACEGSSRFLVEKEYRSASGGDGGVVFHRDRGLEGVNYVNAETDAKYLAKLTASGKARKMSAAEQAEFLTVMAREMAWTEMGFVKTRAGARYYGSYSDYGKRCALVRIEQTGRHERTITATAEKVATVHRFMVCGDKVASLDGSEGEIGLKIKSLVARIESSIYQR